MGRRIAIALITGALLTVLILLLDNLDVSQYVLPLLANDEQRKLFCAFVPAVGAVGFFISCELTALSGPLFNLVVNKSQSLKERAPDVGFTDVKLSIARSTPPYNAGEVIGLDSYDECHYVTCNLVNYGTSRVIAPSIAGHQLAISHIEPRTEGNRDNSVQISLRVHVGQSGKRVFKRKVPVTVQNHNNETFVGTYMLKIDTVNRKAALTLKKGFKKIPE